MSSQTLRCKLSSKDLLLRADPVKQKSNRLSQSISPSNGGWDNDLESQLVRSQLQPLYHSLIGCWLSQRFSFFRSRSFFLLTKCMISSTNHAPLLFTSLFNTYWSLHAWNNLKQTTQLFKLSSPLTSQSFCSLHPIFSFVGFRNPLDSI